MAECNVFKTILAFQAYIPPSISALHCLPPQYSRFYRSYISNNTIVPSLGRIFPVVVFLSGCFRLQSLLLIPAFSMYTLPYLIFSLKMFLLYQGVHKCSGVLIISFSPLSSSIIHSWFKNPSSNFFFREPQTLILLFFREVIYIYIK